MGSMQQLVKKAWHDLAIKVKNDPMFKLNSERGLIFHFALELQYSLRNHNHGDEPAFYFEYDIFKDGSEKSEDRFLDLLIVYRTNGMRGVAFEFKLPQHITANSNQTHRRGQIYWDLHRLWRIVNKYKDDSFKISEAFFLCATNEKAYVKKSERYSINVDCMTYDDYIIPQLQHLKNIKLGKSKDNKPRDFSTPDCPLKFLWEQIGDYWWNAPMRIYIEDDV